MASAAMEQQHLYSSPTTRASNNNSQESVAAAAAVANHHHHHHLLISYHNHNMSSHNQASDAYQYQNQHQYATSAAAAAEQSSQMEPQQQHEHAHDDQHQHAADIYQQHHFFNQYVTSYPSYHHHHHQQHNSANESNSQQSYPYASQANYNTHYQQHYQHSFAQPFGQSAATGLAEHHRSHYSSSNYANDTSYNTSQDDRESSYAEKSRQSDGNNNSASVYQSDETTTTTRSSNVDFEHARPNDSNGETIEEGGAKSSVASKTKNKNKSSNGKSPKKSNKCSTKKVKEGEVESNKYNKKQRKGSTVVTNGKLDDQQENTIQQQERYSPRANNDFEAVAIDDQEPAGWHHHTASRLNTIRLGPQEPDSRVGQLTDLSNSHRVDQYQTEVNSFAAVQHVASHHNQPGSLDYQQQQREARRSECTTPLLGELSNHHDIAHPTAPSSCSSPALAAPTSSGTEFNQLRILEMRKEKSRDAARSRRSKENHEFYELAKLLPLPAAITSQLDFLDKASIIRLTISFLKLRQFSVNGHPPWAPDFTTLGSVNPYSAQSNQASFFNISEPSESKLSSSEQRQNSLTPSNVAFHPPAPSQIPDSYHQQHLAAPSALGCLVSTPAAGDHSMIEKNFVKTNAASLFDIHQGTHILQSLDGFAFAIGRDGRFLYISETVSMYLGLSQVEMTGSSVFDYTHQQDHEELAQQLGIPYSALVAGQLHGQHNPNASYSAAAATGTDSPPASNHSQYSAASSETLIEEHMNSSGVGGSRKRMKVAQAKAKSKRAAHQIKSELQVEESLGDSGLQHERAKPLSNSNNNDATSSNKCKSNNQSGGQAPLANKGDPLVRQFCIRMKSTLTKRGCQHFKSSGYRVVHVVAHLRSYQSNDHGHLMDPLDDSHQQQQQQQPQPIANDHDNPPTSNGESKSQVATNTKQTKRRKGSKTPASEAATSGESNSITEAKGECKLTQVEVSEQAIGKQKPHQKIIGMVAVAIALPPPSINELRLESDTFVLRLGLDLKVTHVEPKITELLHYPIELLAGRSLYSFVHPADLGQVERCHRDLLRKGQMMSGYYRLLSRSGGYIWIQTCATLICNNNTLNTSLLSAAAQAAAAATGGAVSMPLSSDSPGVSMPPQLQMMSNEGHRHQLSQQTPSSSSSYFSPATPTSNQQQQITPSLVSVSLESQLEQQQQQQQEQCVIFVNYMITNVVEQGEILDVCQSKDFMPIMMPCSTPSFASSTLANSNNNNNAYNSPTSSCSSPCLTSFKTGSCLVPPQTTPTHNNNNNIINLSSGSPTSSSIAAVKASRHLLAGRATSDNKHSPKTPRRGSHSATKMARHQQVYSSTDSNGYDQTPPLGASAAAAAALNYSSPYEHGSPMAGVYQQQQSNNHHHHSQHQHQAYLTQQATDGVNLAVSKHHEAATNVTATSRPGTWLNHANHHHHHHHQQQQQQHNRQSHHQVYGTSSNDQNAVSHQQLSQHNNNNNNHNHNHNNQSEQYWNMDRSSIYKAATFAAANLATGYSSAAYHHHPSVAAAAAAASGYAAHHHHHHHLGQHHQHAGHHHHHSLGLAATNHPAAAAWDSLAAAGVNASSGSAVDSSNNLVMGGAASHHVEAAAATAVNPYAHHHHHHHPPWF